MKRAPEICWSSKNVGDWRTRQDKSKYDMGWRKREASLAVRVEEG